jgi:hypothetical protein
LEIRVGEDLDTSGDREGPLTRLVDVSALEGIDRHVLRWTSEALLSAARRLVADGSCEGDVHVIATARAILRDGGRGGRRPENEPAIAVQGPRSADEDVVLRIWPERAAPAAPGQPAVLSRGCRAGLHGRRVTLPPDRDSGPATQPVQWGDSACRRPCTPRAVNVAP